MNEPTREIQKEFWEKLGFVFVPRKESPRFGGEQDYWAVYNHWLYPDGTRHENLPSLEGVEALGNLFKWAVPKTSEKPEIRLQTGYPFRDSLHCELWTHMPSGNTQEYEFTVHSVPNPTEKHYTLALFWAIWQVIEKEKRRE